MNNCERFTELFSDYAENTLLAEKKSALEAHLNHCSECRSAAGGIINLRRVLHRLSTVHTSPDFETILRTRIKLDRRASLMPLWGMRHLGGPIRLATYSVAAILVVISAAYLWQIQSEKSHSSSPSSIVVSPMPIAPNKPSAPVSSAKIFYTLDKVTPQLWPNLGVTRKATDQSPPSAPKDTLRARPRVQSEVTPVSHQAITF